MNVDRQISRGQKKTEEIFCESIFYLVILQINLILFEILSQMAGVIPEILTRYLRFTVPYNLS